MTLQEKYDFNIDAYYRGTKFKVNDVTHMLCEAHEEEYVFQILCIEGYHAGCWEGWIRKEEKWKDTHSAVSKEHLQEEIKRNFQDVERLEILGED